MPDFRYAQFCPLARAAEVLGERWTLLIVRELLLGPQRFSDLRRRLPGLSSSVLAERLERMERRAIVTRRRMAPPAASSVYELGHAGRALVPVMIELARWGVRFLLPATPDDHLEPDWLRMALRGFAARGPSPARSYEVRVLAGAEEIAATIAGGPDGTQVRDGATGPGADVRLRASPPVLLGLMAGLLDPVALRASGELVAEGDLAALPDFPRLFEIDFGGALGAAAAARPPTETTTHREE